MGSVCARSNNTRKVVITSNLTVQAAQTEREATLPADLIGVKFQERFEANDPLLNKKKERWNDLFKALEALQASEEYKKLVAQPRATGFSDNKNEIIRFDQLDQIDEEQSALPPVQKRNSKSANIPTFEKSQSFKLSDPQTLKMYLLKESQNQRFQNLLFKGALSSFRWSAWIAQVYNSDIYDSNLYQDLLASSDLKNEDSITKDIHRTFPKHLYFARNNSGPLQLHRILKALATKYPDVGYTQGMNQVVAFAIIMSSGNEEEAFWLLNFMANDPKYLLLQLFKPQFQYVKLLIKIFMGNFQREMPALFEHFQEHQINEHCYILKWILTLFLYSFPLEAVVSFWDFIIGTNILAILALSMSILQSYGDQLCRKDMDLEKIANFIQNLQYMPIPKGWIQDVIKGAVKFQQIIAQALSTYLEKDCVYSQIIQQGFVMVDQLKQELTYLPQSRQPYPEL